LNTSRNFYPNICTTHTYEERIANIKMLQGLGFEICCGGIIGLGESLTDVADMLFDVREIRPQSVPVNFLIPLQGTTLAGADTSHLSPGYCLKVLCLARLMTPESDIRCAAGREVYLKGREKEMFCAVDSIFASGYLTTGGQSIDETIKLVTEAGFEYRLEEE
jgi:biotin synthase